MDKDCAEKAYKKGLKSIEELTSLLEAIDSQSSQGVYERIKKGIGLSIGSIQINILDVITSVYPELDDLQ